MSRLTKITKNMNEEKMKRSETEEPQASKNRVKNIHRAR